MGREPRFAPGDEVGVVGAERDRLVELQLGKRIPPIRRRLCGAEHGQCLEVDAGTGVVGDRDGTGVGRCHRAGVAEREREVHLRRAGVAPELEDDEPRGRCDIGRRDAVSFERPHRPLTIGLLERLANQVVVAGGEVGVHEGDRCQVLVLRCVLGSAFDVVRHQRHVATGHLAGQLLHLLMVHGGEGIVVPARCSGGVRNHLEPALGPAGQLGGTTIEDVELGRLGDELAAAGSEVQRGSTEHVGGRKPLIGHMATLRNPGGSRRCRPRWIDTGMRTRCRVTRSCSVCSDISTVSRHCCAVNRISPDEPTRPGMFGSDERGRFSPATAPCGAPQTGGTKCS